MSPLHILSAVALMLAVIGAALPNHYALVTAVVLLAVCNFLK